MFKAMIKPRRMITVGGTLFCVWAIGYLMQSNAQNTAPQAQGAPTPEVEVEPLAESAEAPLVLSDIRMTSALSIPSAPPEAAASLPEAPVFYAPPATDRPVAALPAEEKAPNFACETTVTATPDTAAMVTLLVDASCMTNARFTVHHNGMMFSDVTDESGKRELSVPALAADAVYIVSFAAGGGGVAAVTVPSAGDYDRVVVQWAGDSGLQIHALEFGATYQQPGHVWLNQARDKEQAERGEGGFITRLGTAGGSDATTAEIYSFPSGKTARAGVIGLHVEAEITLANCNRDIEAQSIQTVAGGALKEQRFTLAMPDCSAVGDFLVLKNLLNDLKIARN